MNAREYVAWASPLLGGRGTPARELFLALPGRWSRAVGASRGEHFLESSLCSTARNAVKLALILKASPAALRARPWRDDDGKERAGARLLAALNRAGSRYDAAAYERACALLRRWGLRGSLMLSCDFEPGAQAFGKLTFYGYAPPGEPVGDLASALAPGEPVEPRGDAGALEFWGLDLWPTGETALKLYRRRPYSRRDVPPELRTLAAALETAAEPRDLTLLSRLPARGGDKLYLGFAEGVPVERLRRLPAPAEAARFFARLERTAAGQRVYFIGFSPDGALEAYFDRREPEHEEKGPLDDDL